MEPVQPPRIPGQPPEATSPSQPVETPSQTPESILDKFQGVVIRGYEFGKELSEKGATVKLTDIYGKNGENQANYTIYFRTPDNIYLITSQRDNMLRVISAMDAGAGRGTGIDFRTDVDLKGELEANSKITVGESFKWNKGSASTGAITEAVIIDKRNAGSVDLDGVPPNSIAEDFSAIVAQAKIDNSPQGK